VSITRRFLPQRQAWLVHSKNSDSPNETWREKCGVFGVYAPGEDVSRITFYGIYALQHRGQESAGIATADGFGIHLHSGMGLVSQVFEENDLGYLPGHAAIGHTRYSTTGSSRKENAQPVRVDGAHGPLAMGHNGNLINAELLRYDLEDQGHEFTGSTDTEVAAKMLASAPGADWLERASNTMKALAGAYCLVALTPDVLIAMRDPYGVRPLCIGKLNGNGWIVASESCALDHLGAEFVREVEPGEAVVIDEQGLHAMQAVEKKRDPPRQHNPRQAAPPDAHEHGPRAGAPGAGGCRLGYWRAGLRHGGRDRVLA